MNAGKTQVYNKVLLWLASSLSCISNLETYIITSKKQKKKERKLGERHRACLLYYTSYQEWQRLLFSSLSLAHQQPPCLTTLSYMEAIEQSSKPQRSSSGKMKLPWWEILCSRWRAAFTWGSKTWFHLISAWLLSLNWKQAHFLFICSWNTLWSHPRPHSSAIEREVSLPLAPLSQNFPWQQNERWLRSCALFPFGTGRSSEGLNAAESGIQTACWDWIVQGCPGDHQYKFLPSGIKILHSQLTFLSKPQKRLFQGFSVWQMALLTDKSIISKYGSCCS